MGAPLTVWARKDGTPYEGESALDVLDEQHKPYLLQVRVLFEGPMRLVVWNQNRSHVLFGNEEGSSSSRNIA